MMTMQLLLLTVVMTLPSVEQKSFGNLEFDVTADELLGKWYIVAWAGNVFLPEKRKFSPLPPFTFVRNIIGKLEFRMNISKPIGCIEFRIYMDEHKSVLGVFKIWPEHIIRFVFVQGKDFAVAAYINKMNKYKLTMLMGRNMTPKRIILSEFEGFVVNLGLNRTDIIRPKCDDSCELSIET